MKLLLIVFLGESLISCGKNENNSKKTNSKGIQEQEKDEGHAGRNSYVDISSQSEVDLLNATINQLVEINGDRITFLNSAFEEDKGNRISCHISINQDDIWHYTVSGDKLELSFPSGQKVELSRIGKSSHDLNGSWLWRGNQGNVKIIRRYTFLPKRILINQDCEG
jgi:hypothetical protein